MLKPWHQTSTSEISIPPKTDWMRKLEKERKRKQKPKREGRTQ